MKNALDLCHELVKLLILNAQKSSPQVFSKSQGKLLLVSTYNNQENEFILFQRDRKEISDQMKTETQKDEH
jgi:hypothetical protein